MPPDDPHGSMNEVWVDWSFSSLALDRRLAASPPLRLAMRTQLHFSFGSSLDVAISVRGQAALGLWPKATKTRAKASASRLHGGRRESAYKTTVVAL